MKLNFGRAYRKFLRLLTSTISSYTVICSLIAGAFGLGIWCQNIIATKEYTRLCLEMLEKEKSSNKDNADLYREIYELRQRNIDLNTEIIELKTKILSYERKKSK